MSTSRAPLPSPATRRDVLVAAASLPAIFGLAALFGRSSEGGDAPPADAPKADAPSDPAEIPTWWPEFRERLADGMGVGVIVRVPATAAARRALGTTLVDLVDRGTADQRLLTIGAVVACLTPAQRRTVLPKLPAADGLILVARALERIDGVALADEDAADPVRVWSALEGVVYGAKGARLAERARSARASMPAATIAAYDRLATDEDRAAAAAFPQIAPVIAAELRGSPTAPRRAAVEAWLAAWLGDRPFSPTHPYFHLPLGIEETHRGGGCGEPTVDANGKTLPPPPCGMALPPAGSFRFLRFLVDRPA